MNVDQMESELERFHKQNALLELNIEELGGRSSESTGRKKCIRNSKGLVALP